MKYRYSNDLDALDILAEDLKAFGKQHNIPTLIVSKLNLVLDELLTNIISYAYEQEREHIIEMEITFTREKLSVILIDDGLAFDPVKKVQKNVDLEKYQKDKVIGGLGLLFVSKFIDSMSYERKGDKNYLTFTKNLISKG